MAKVPVQVYDLSATPFYLRGSGEDEGTLFPWLVSDFSPIDAIECGIVKGQRDMMDDAKHDTTRRLWVPAVNADGRFGRWDFLRIDGPYDTGPAIDGRLTYCPIASS